ncbi:MAG TPA: Omp28 family outer membrane lipoprotein [Bacteroidia bacterium]|nr:Omp28 family outer membrane lipoprotein [Bacteroidia bacterium]HNT79098.1 Omp28 family outer membrane lipoprotein [Bacteroidia bacterium]
MNRNSTLFYSYLLQICFVFVLSFSACDIIKEPYLEEGGGNGTNDSVLRKVIIEDFTGHLCANCPDAHRESDALKNIFGKQLIVLSIHSGDFAIPLPAGAPKYTYDFRTPEGNELNNYFQLMSWPNGVVNRTSYGGSLLLNYPSWGAAVGDLINLPAEAQIELDHSYDSTTRTLNTTISVEMLEDMNGILKVCAFIVEDSIINWQLDDKATPKDVQFYVHKHVLRGSLFAPPHNTWGKEIANGPVSSGDTFTLQESKNISANYNENQVSVIAYIYNDVTKEIIQAEEAKILP